MKVKNPVLTGFHPDPSILRVGENYYLATSTFQWFPGVEIFHSTDLANWNFITRPLNEKRLLDMTGIPDSGGVWAPCLSYSDGIYYLVYSNVKTYRNYYKDVDNFIVTSADITGPWSDPVRRRRWPARPPTDPPSGGRSPPPAGCQRTAAAVRRGRRSCRASG